VDRGRLLLGFRQKGIERGVDFRGAGGEIIFEIHEVWKRQSVHRQDAKDAKENQGI
jgi:hypothetical protein